jgi:hypothetical protein
LLRPDWPVLAGSAPAPPGWGRKIARRCAHHISVGEGRGISVCRLLAVCMHSQPATGRRTEGDAGTSRTHLPTHRHTYSGHPSPPPPQQPPPRSARQHLSTFEASLARRDPLDSDSSPSPNSSTPTRRTTSPRFLGPPPSPQNPNRPRPLGDSARRIHPWAGQRSTRSAGSWTYPFSFALALALQSN